MDCHGHLCGLESRASEAQLVPDADDLEVDRYIDGRLAVFGRSSRFARAKRVENLTFLTHIQLALDEGERALVSHAPR